MRKVILISQRVTGQTPGYSPMSKDLQAFPADYKEDAFAEYCLDAPLYLPCGNTLAVLTHDQNHIWGLATAAVREGTYWSLS